MLSSVLPSVLPRVLPSEGDAWRCLCTYSINLKIRIYAPVHTVSIAVEHGADDCWLLLAAAGCGDLQKSERPGRTGLGHFWLSRLPLHTGPCQMLCSRPNPTPKQVSALAAGCSRDRANLGG